MIITGMGYAHPEHRIPNTFFDRLEIGSSGEWIKEKTGIGNRYSVLSMEQLARLHSGDETAHTLRQKNEIPRIEELSLAAWNHLSSNHSHFTDWVPELLICGTSVPDYFIPSNAAVIAAKLGWNSVAMDCNTACSSFVSNLQLAAGQVLAGYYENVCIVNPERYTAYLDYSDRRSCFLFGDGAAISTISVNPAASGLRLIDVLVESDPSGFELVQIPVHSTFYQNGSRVQKFAISKTCEVSRKILSQNGFKTQDVDYFVGHQANLRMLKSSCEKLGVEQKRHLYNVDTHGNQGGAGAAIVLATNWHKFKPGDLILVAVVGSGLTWGAALFKFQ